MNDELKTFVQSQELFNAYKQYLALEDMTMVEFAEIVYPLIAQAVNAAREKEA